MSFFDTLFGPAELRKLDPRQKAEVSKLIEELLKIGQTDDYLSVVPGGPFDFQCHHNRARQIGQRINEIGGLPLMWAVRQSVKRKLKGVLAEHLDHCWKGIGMWVA